MAPCALQRSKAAGQRASVQWETTIAALVDARTLAIVHTRGAHTRLRVVLHAAHILSIGRKVDGRPPDGGKPSGSAGEIGHFVQVGRAHAEVGGRGRAQLGRAQPRLEHALRAGRPILGSHRDEHQ
eukprot:7381221-Prymnesium_polylepis.2